MRFIFSYHTHALPNRVLKDYLENHGIDHKCPKEGEVEILSSLSSEKLTNLERHLERYGMQLLEDEKNIFVQRIKNLLIELAYSDKPLTVTLSHYLSTHLGYSYAHLALIFERSTFCSIERYLIHLKIERVKRLIIEDQLPLKEIAGMVNYCSVGHLSKQFKKITGLSITTFRKIILNKKGRN